MVKAEARPPLRAPGPPTLEATEREFGSVEIIKSLGISGRQLQWWDERGVLKPRHAGHRRYYTREDVIALWAVKQLRARGLSLQSVRKVLRQMRKQLEPLIEGIASGGRVLVVTTLKGREVGCYGFNNQLDQIAAVDHMLDMTDAAVVIKIGPELWRLLMPIGGRRRECA